MENHCWWKEAVVYQIYPRSFCDSNGDGIGDLNGITGKLDYLKELGIDVIWISPFYKSPGVDNGYDISDYQDINPEYGNLDDFENLLKEAHKRGLKIVIDLVVNHTSTEHKWFIESRKGRENSYHDYYIWRDGKDGKAPNNWGSIFSGPAWKYDDEAKQFYLHLFAEEQADLNWENPKVRADIYSMMDWWCKKGVDGFRMDVIGMIGKDPKLPDGKVHSGNVYGDFGKYVMNRNRTHDLLKEMNERILSNYDIMTVGETSGVSPKDALRYAGFDSAELNMVFQFERIDSESEPGFKWIEKEFDLIRLKKIFEKWQVKLEGKAWNSLFWENHDQPRIVSRYNCDGEYRIPAAKMLAVSLYFQKGTPYIYEGQEICMTNNHFNDLSDFNDLESINAYHDMINEHGMDKEKAMHCLNRVSRDNARTPMQWNAEENAGFTSGKPWLPVNKNYTKINVASQKNDPDSILNFYKKLISIRKENPVAVYGKFKLLEKKNPKLLVYTREYEGKKLLVVCNFSKTEVEYSKPESFKDGELILSNYKDSDYKKLRPYEAQVFLL